MGVAGLGFLYVYIMLCTGYVQIPGNHISSHAFLWKIKYRFVVESKEN